MAADAILVNKQPLRTTVLLREALLSLRDGLEEPLTLWVDAICINQSDPEERRDQVIQMRRIYACAQQTRIQLDDDEEQGEINWSRLEDAIEMIQLARDFLESYPLDWVSQKEGGPLFHIGDTDAILDENQIKHLYMIYAVLPTTLIALRRQTRDNKPASLLSILRKAWYHEATDPRDKVYALLGLVAEDERSRYPVGYSVSTEKAYSLTTKIMLKHECTMEVLCLAGIDQRSTVDLPSWCPDWRTLEQAVDNKKSLNRE
ncbi:hypothetical protein N0V83_003855 [Neocucurbitaria cava]|uniref:Heterokaryon incompatibility domain-containing protein n=1 Tax=Neocucurbitaria cava TaxID=798079 RepID=A0A9W9CMR4_9PLEO|nr:hypothetical protein N0V83_003855 [Neocucurbitaria cava]